MSTPEILSRIWKAIRRRPFGSWWYLGTVVVASVVVCAGGWLDPVHKWVLWSTAGTLWAIAIVADNDWRTWAGALPVVGPFVRWLTPELRLPLALGALTALVVGSIFDPNRMLSYSLAIAFVLLFGFRDQELRTSAREILFAIFPFLETGRMYDDRKEEYRAVIENLKQTLKDFEVLPYPKTEFCSALVLRPPERANEFIHECCKEFALECGHDAMVLELLYRGSRGKATNHLWQEAKRPHSSARPATGIRKILATIWNWLFSHLPFIPRTPAPTGSAANPIPPLDQLAKILARTDQISRFANPLDTEKSLKEIFKNLNEFRLVPDEPSLRGEMDSAVALWRDLTSYTDFLSGLHRGFTRNFSPVEVTEFLRKHESREEILTEASKNCFEQWAESDSAAAKLSANDVHCLALVALGIFAAETAPPEFLRESDLGWQVHENKKAMRILFSHLWIRSQPSAKTRRFELQPLVDFREIEKEAAARLSDSFCQLLRSDIRSRLRRGLWPTDLPMKLAIAEVNSRIQQLAKLKRTHVRGENWRQELEEIVAWAGGDNAIIADLDDEALIRMGDNKLRDVLPHDKRPKRGAVTKQISRIAGDLDKLTREFRPEAPTVVGSSAELGGQIAEIREMLWAEQGGNPAYIISFDQRIGHSALLVDCLKNKYGFVKYTEYTRIGELHGETFEAFYERLISDLKQLMNALLRRSLNGLRSVGSGIGADEAAIDKLQKASQPNARHWRKVEISVQQISRLHRHDFVRDVWTAQPDNISNAYLETILKNPPSSEEFLRPTAQSMTRQEVMNQTSNA